MKKMIIITVLSAVGVNGMAQEPTDSTRTLEGEHQLDELIVVSRSAKERLNNVQAGLEKINLVTLSKAPALFGEKDLLKSLQLLPGVQAESENSSGFQVRGGTATQNQILLDDVSIYQAGHLMGLFSTFNDDALYNVSLYKGLIPAQYGGATSSVLTVNTRSGNMNDYHYGTSIGLLSAKAFVEGPIAQDKASFFVSARRSYMDLFLKASEDYKNTSLYFYDINAKIDWMINSKDRLNLSFFNGRDVIGLTDLADANWHNTSLSMRWLHYFNEQLSSNAVAYYSEFKDYMNSDFIGTSYDQTGYIRHYGLKYTFMWTPMSKLRWNFGVQSDYTNLCSAEWTIGNTTENEIMGAWENSTWVNGLWNPMKKLSLSAGIRAGIFLPDNNRRYLLVEPRLSVNYEVASGHNIKAGYSRTYQNIHAVTDNSSSWPFDRYIMSNGEIKPEQAHQVSLGYFTRTKNGDYDFSLEGYYKIVNNVYDYRDGKNYRSDIMMENIVLGGKSHAYGLEVAAHKNTGRFTGWLSYTLSWVNNQIDGVNGGNWYTASNDRRHDLSVVGMYQLSPKWDVSASWKYTSGQALSAPSAKYQQMGKNAYFYAERNGYRAPAYHRLDLSTNCTTVGKKYTTIWSFGIYNAYGQHNPYLINFQQDDTKPSGMKVTKTSLFNFIPSISFTIKY